MQTESYRNNVEEWGDGERAEEEKINDGLINAMISISHVLKTELCYETSSGVFTIDFSLHFTMHFSSSISSSITNRLVIFTLLQLPFHLCYDYFTGNVLECIHTSFLFDTLFL